MFRPLLAVLLLALAPLGGARAAPAKINVDGYAALALTCIHQQYPNHLSLAVGADADVMPPYALHPSFYGCLDWHSAVHGHWLLVRLLREHPKAAWADEARHRLDEDFSPGRLAIACHRRPGLVLRTRLAHSRPKEGVNNLPDVPGDEHLRTVSVR